ncbi:hypothetical protein PTTG_01630 [Puccinia triticina 1-1 BBBD Race 1]|uniref:Uncharacterized protein n=1 Tax=Puccinia triticina (isolate 1-1 / race 1 (BBBD)) TaxID=630390 RepID=A0A0C4ELJ6_PUCT1|nr:hypothetical protein PTTG_01630 [Puccinia triticina 1-1 BBBD Race 1]
MPISHHQQIAAPLADLPSSGPRALRPNPCASAGVNSALANLTHPQQPLTEPAPFQLRRLTIPSTVIISIATIGLPTSSKSEYAQPTPALPFSYNRVPQLWNYPAQTFLSASLFLLWNNIAGPPVHRAPR